ncbi:MAG: glycine cleavage system protein H [Dehalococcoidales bacterium]|nr:glycine cleavage system protein H [Dehalococcoidales bacterium]MDD3264437.1 glycine cleavage system protein H [Dehalococcoidales bacterium]MDD4321977.1 glycine cleavage system protein H [Dehalococcoidales bacterium]MDD4794738.1 glycine cleavage system protein H [Dehalococcoidales bacterium]MDD5122622.1 glycine cleavage system protein H [Dehalococcoidales bacterium]
MTGKETYYTSDHLWVEHVGGSLYRIGVTYEYLDRLATIRIVELPEAGSKIEQGANMAVLESSKAAVELPAPFNGIVSKANAEAVADPGIINREPMGKGWLLEVEYDSSGSPGGLITEEEYRKLL